MVVLRSEDGGNTLRYWDHVAGTAFLKRSGGGFLKALTVPFWGAVDAGFLWEWNVTKSDY